MLEIVVVDQIEVRFVILHAKVEGPQPISADL
jgi:hypothetical protein